LSYRLTVHDKDGRKVAQNYYGESGTASVLQASLAKVATITVETRPYIYIEFGDVHYDPEAKLWPKAYWGSEGDKAIRRAGEEVELDGLLRSRVEQPRWKAAEFYAPDGKAWRESSNPNLMKVEFSTSSWPAGEYLVGVLKLPSIGDRSAMILPYAADSDRPGEGLRDLAPGYLQYKVNRVEVHVPFEKPPAAKFVQFEVRFSSNEWKSAGEVEVPAIPLKSLTPDETALIRKGVGIYDTAFTVLLRSNGRLDFYFQPKDGNGILQQKLLSWEPSDETRLIARLKGGSKLVLENNGSGESGDGTRSIDYLFNLDHESNPVLEAYKTKVALTDIRAFEVETRGFGKPIYVSATLPAPRG